MSVIGRSRGPLGSSLAAWEASGGVRRGPGRPQKATVCVADCTPTRVNPYPPPGIVVGAVHGHRDTRTAAGGAPEPRRQTTPDGFPGPPECEEQLSH